MSQAKSLNPTPSLPALVVRQNSFLPATNPKILLLLLSIYLSSRDVTTVVACREGQITLAHQIAACWDAKAQRPTGDVVLWRKAAGYDSVFPKAFLSSLGT